MPKTTFTINNSPTSFRGKVRFGMPTPPPPYSIGGVSPELVASFTLGSNNSTEGEYFRKAGSDTTFGDLFTFTRTGSAWYFNSSGVLTEATSGNARRDAYYYNGTAWTKGGLQLESAAATNLHDYSSDFTQTGYWDVTPNTSFSSGTAINGIETKTCTATDTSFAYVATTNYTFSSAGTYTHSVYFRPGTAPVMWMDFRNFANSTPGQNEAYFDSATETISGGVAAASMTFEKVGADEYRISFTSTVDAGDLTGLVRFGYCDAAGSPSVTNGATAEFGGAQLEEGPFATSLIPTNGSTVTRAAETLTIAAANLNYSPTANCIAMSGLMTYADEDTNGQIRFVDWFDSTSAYTRVYLSTDGSKTGTPWVEQDSGSPNAKSNRNGTDVYSPGINVPFSLAWRHLEDSVQLAADGTAFAEGTDTGSWPDLSGADYQIATVGFNGFISQFRMWDEDIGDSGIEEVTS